MLVFVLCACVQQPRAPLFGDKYVLGLVFGIKTLMCGFGFENDLRVFVYIIVRVWRFRIWNLFLWFFQGMRRM